MQVTTFATQHKKCEKNQKQPTPRRLSFLLAPLSTTYSLEKGEELKYCRVIDVSAMLAGILRRKASFQMFSMSSCDQLRTNCNREEIVMNTDTDSFRLNVTFSEAAQH